MQSMTRLSIDIKENFLDSIDSKILKILLKDNTTRKNIIWGTDDYIQLGSEYAADKQIFPGLITGFYGSVIRPRTEKSKDEQTSRVRSKAEVFTPSWVCNKQNNLIDNEWFGRVNVFNLETEDGWISTANQISFPEDKTWQDYVKLNRLEITCGEAPYLVSRYDTVTGVYIPVEERVGLLDRKLRIVSENCGSEEEWFTWAIKAVQSVYGYDWQGDNILIARENILFTVADYFEAKYRKALSQEQLIAIAKIVAWNIWQMDGIRFVVPNSCHETVESQITIDGEKSVYHQCLGCKDNNHSMHNGIYARTYDWVAQHSVPFIAFIDSSFRRK